MNSLVIECEKCVIDLTYDEEKFRIKYPMKKPIEIPITNDFFRDCQTMTLTVMIVVGKKYKKVARGKINLYKKYFMGDKNSHEKWVYLTLLQKQIEELGKNSDIIKAELNKGKIYMKINVLNPVVLRKKMVMKDPI